MQYHLHGFKPSNLQVAESVREASNTPPIEDLPTEVDVIIVSCESAGLMLARLLSEFPKINI